MNYKNEIEEILAIAGITINGKAPWDIRVHNDALWKVNWA